MKACGRIGLLPAVVGVGSALVGSFAATAAWAESSYGHAVPGEFGFQKPVTDLARYLQWFHNDILLPITVAICVFVAALLIYCIWRFNEKANPTPSKTTHNTGLEIAWTVIPVMILVFIAIPSFRLLTMQLTIPKADVTIKVTASQWHWNYGYPKGQGDFSFDSYLRDDADMKKGDLRLLEVDNEAVIPVNKIVVLQITATDVIHSFVVQSFGVRMDAVPGRLNQTWFKADRLGVYRGQCSKLCGKDHAFMPIVFRVVSDDDYKAWLVNSKKKYAETGSPDRYASAVNAVARE